MYNSDAIRKICRLIGHANLLAENIRVEKESEKYLDIDKYNYIYRIYIYIFFKHCGECL